MQIVFTVVGVANFLSSTPFQFLILASDGVWDGITNREAVDIVEQQRDPTRAAKALVKAGLAGMDRNHLEDNATAVVVYFN